MASVSSVRAQMLSISVTQHIVCETMSKLSSKISSHTVNNLCSFLNVLNFSSYILHINKTAVFTHIILIATNYQKRDLWHAFTSLWLINIIMITTHIITNISQPFLCFGFFPSCICTNVVIVYVCTDNKDKSKPNSSCKTHVICKQTQW